MKKEREKGFGNLIMKMDDQNQKVITKTEKEMVNGKYMIIPEYIKKLNTGIMDGGGISSYFTKTNS